MKSNYSSHSDALLRNQIVAKKAVHYAARFLKAPVSNTLRYQLGRLLRAIPFLPERTRDKLDLSVRKRDFRSLSAILQTQPDLLEPRSVSDLRDAFRTTLPEKRRITLLSDEHVRLRTASDRNSASVAVTISLVTYNSARWLAGFFTSLRAQRYPLDMLTLRIAEHGSNDDTIAQIERFLADHGSEFRNAVLVCRENDGFGGGQHANIQASDDDFVLVSNVDLEFGPDTISDLVAAARADADDVACWETRQCPFEHPKFYDPVTLETAWCSHSCILLRRDAYHAVGGYERRIFMYGEDAELSYRFRSAGWRLRYLPHVPVRHFVDFDDPILRPHQLSGSVSANILLRYRYGGEDAGVAGEQILAQAIANEDDRGRKKALLNALERVEQDRDHFTTNHKPVSTGVFPFDGLDYDIARLGHDIALDSLTPFSDLPKVSIITRTHGPNQAILHEAIVSVLNQTYPNIEHLIVEDRSSRSEALVADVAQTYGANIRFLKSERSGRAAAGNAGLEAATGDLLLFFDNDDLLFADHVETLVRALLAEPDCAAAYSLSWEVATFFSASGAYREEGLFMPPAYANAYDARRFEKGNFLPIQSVLFHRSLYEAEGGIDETIDHLEDWNLWSRYARRGQFRLVPKTTSIYRIPGDPVFRENRRRVMRAAEDAVRQMTFSYVERRETV